MTESYDAIQMDNLSSLCSRGGEGADRKERRDAAEHRQRVLAAARTLFAQQGVDATSMAEIARAAQVGQGTLYRRYAHKGELCMALLGENVRRFHDEIHTYLETTGAAMPALGQLDFLLVRLVDFNEENTTLLGAAGDAACGERRTSAYHSPLYLWLREMVVTLLRSAAARHEIAPLDVEATADVVLAPLAIDLYLHQRHELHYTPERITAALRRLIFDGLRAR